MGTSLVTIRTRPKARVAGKRVGEGVEEVVRVRVCKGFIAKVKSLEYL